MLIDVNVECSCQSGRWRLVDGCLSQCRLAGFLNESERGMGQ